MKKRRRIKLKSLGIVFCVFTVVLYLAVSIILHSFNVNLASQLALNETRIEELKAEVDAITIQVKELTDYNRVMDTVDSDMNTSASIVVSIDDSAN